MKHATKKHYTATYTLRKLLSNTSYTSFIPLCIAFSNFQLFFNLAISTFSSSFKPKKNLESNPWLEMFTWVGHYFDKKKSLVELDSEGSPGSGQISQLFERLLVYLQITQQRGNHSDSRSWTHTLLRNEPTRYQLSQHSFHWLLELGTENSPVTR